MVALQLFDLFMITDMLDILGLYAPISFLMNNIFSNRKKIQIQLIVPDIGVLY